MYFTDWCDSCLRHPHDYTDGHQIPEKKSAKGEEEKNNMTRNMETKTSDDEQERKRKEMSGAEQVDLAYPLEECEFRMQTEYSQVSDVLVMCKVIYRICK